MKKSTAFYLVIISIAMFLVALFIPVMTILVILWSLLLIAFFSIFFYLMGDLLADLIGWVKWRVKLQMKRCKERGQVKRNSKN